MQTFPVKVAEEGLILLSRERMVAVCHLFERVEEKAPDAVMRAQVPEPERVIAQQADLLTAARLAAARVLPQVFAAKEYSAQEAAAFEQAQVAVARVAVAPAGERAVRCGLLPYAEGFLPEYLLQVSGLVVVGGRER